MEKITTATKITITRIFAIIPTMIFYILAMVLWEKFELKIAFTILAAVLFILLCTTDFIDGHIARKTGTVSELGKFLDPLADKIVVLIMLCLYITFSNGRGTYFEIYPYSSLVIAILTVLIFTRELAIGIFRAIAAKKGIVLSADLLGKLKTIFLNISVSGLVFCHFDIEIANAIMKHNPNIHYAYILGPISHIIFYVAAILALVSGFHYVIKNKEVFK